MRTFFFLKIFIICFWLCWIFVAARGFFFKLWQAGATLVVLRLPTVVASLAVKHWLSRVFELQWLQFLGSRAQAQ